MLSFPASAAETVCTGDIPSGLVAAPAPASSETLLLVRPISGRGRGGDEIASLPPPNRQADRRVAATVEEQGVSAEPLTGGPPGRTGVLCRGDRLGSEATFLKGGGDAAAVWTAAAAVGEARLVAAFPAAAIDGALVVRGGAPADPWGTYGVVVLEEATRGSVVRSGPQEAAAEVVLVGDERSMMFSAAADVAADLAGVLLVVMTLDTISS